MLLVITEDSVLHVDIPEPTGDNPETIFNKYQQIFDKAISCNPNFKYGIIYTFRPLYSPRVAFLTFGQFLKITDIIDFVAKSIPIANEEHTKTFGNIVLDMRITSVSDITPQLDMIIKDAMESTDESESDTVQVTYLGNAIDSTSVVAGRLDDMPNIPLEERTVGKKWVN